MPPKDTQEHELLFDAEHVENAHELFYSTDGGETMMPLGHISEALIIDDLIPEDQTHLPFVKPDDAIMFSCKFRMDNSAAIFLATGKWPSNNWLKMHGIPMRRAHGNRSR